MSKKDPAFLFYSNSFYEGTRMMLPNERACYVDLMIYQHQHEIIPNNIERLLMYCSGIDKATLIATLEAKFKLTDNGYVNESLLGICAERKEYASKQSINGKVGQFFKKAKALLDAKSYFKLRELFVNQSNEEIFEQIKSLEINKATLQGLLKHILKDKDVIKDINETKDIVEIVKKEKPLIFPYDSPTFVMAWTALLQEKKWLKKSQGALQASLNKLSRHPEQQAILMIEAAIAGEWQGIHELTNPFNNGKTGNKNSDQTSLGGLADKSREVLRKFASEND